jgi:hypothetical protein
MLEQDKRLQFKEYFDLRHPNLKGGYGIPGELFTDTFNRVANTFAEYVNTVLDNKKES